MLNSNNCSEQSCNTKKRILESTSLWSESARYAFHCLRFWSAQGQAGLQQTNHCAPSSCENLRRIGVAYCIVIEGYNKGCVIASMKTYTEKRARINL